METDKWIHPPIPSPTSEPVNSGLTETQRRRAEALRFANRLFPDLPAYQARDIAQWIVRGHR